MIARSWCEIDLEQLKENYKICSSTLKSNCEITAVVKADAYGHGAVPISKALQSVGCKNFAVSNLEEGIQLRNCGVDGQILILGYTPVAMMTSVKNNSLCQTVYSSDYAESLLQENKSVNVQIAIDTGMNRIGFRWGNYREIEKVIGRLKQKCKIIGIFTHLACADEESYKNFTDMQIDRFNNTLRRLEDFGVGYRHFSNSAYFLEGGRDLFNSVRLGICLYGLGKNRRCPIKPILKWKSVVVMVKRVKAGEGVGYGLAFIPKRDCLIATVSTGYADGLSFALSNCGKVEIKGKLVPIVGRICMDAFMVDVSEVGEISLGEEVVLIGDKYGVSDMAKDVKTIPYDVVCSISKRVARVYVDRR